MKNVLERVEKGIIRIENGHLIGLGASADNSINLNQLDELMDWMGKDGVVETLSAAMSAIGCMQNEMNLYEETDHEEIKAFISSKLRPSLYGIDFFSLNSILKAFLY